MGLSILPACLQVFALLALQRRREGRVNTRYWRSTPELWRCMCCGRTEHETDLWGGYERNTLWYCTRCADTCAHRPGGMGRHNHAR